MRRIIIRYLQQLPRRFSRVHELPVQVIKSLVTESRVADVLKSFQCKLPWLRLKDDFVRVFGQFVIEHYHQYLGFRGTLLLIRLCFFEVVMETRVCTVHQGATCMEDDVAMLALVCVDSCTLYEADKLNTVT